ncbi:MAG: adenylate/guanylate cyclase domain-containing protein [Actinomycetota bacterium]
MRCPSCATDNREGRKFCAECGGPLAASCPSCGTANEPGEKFCGECGTALQAPRGDGTAAAPAPDGETSSGGSSERRLVSVLFADLVGFTTLSENRDAEEVRELLSGYFDTARRIVARYGGTIEKFIGDAVMAVWGAPTAQEDDAERAVRAALDLTAGVAQLGRDTGATDLAARAGVLTGEAAVTLGARDEGMVAGDLVNTASRIQSLADPGMVLVGEATRRASEAAIAYEDRGRHELKGKAEPVPLYRALRVVASRKGFLRTTGLETPFVGREREMHVIKELFHTSADERRAHLLSVIGIAGIGKSRTAAEFENYIDGLAEVVLWHRGRCLAYGEGVAYWALAEMVRMRARIAEEEEPASALEKLRVVIEEVVPDADERNWIEPRVAHLLGLEERSAGEREELFSAWRMLFERLADQNPTVMVFEDLHWADTSLLDFIGYLLDWSRNSRLFVITLARPELIERRPRWGVGKRNFSSLFLEPLTDGSMSELLRATVPGLPETLLDRIRDRAEGVPLYAVETLRMLLDRGVLVREGATYRVTGEVQALEVPETLHALIAARLDGLPPEERRLLQNASVLGKTFTREGLARMTDTDERTIEGPLSSLLRKELLTLQADPRSPERGQYGFMQALVQKVSYDTLSKKDRKVRHLAVARYLETTWSGDEDEIIEVVASHYLDAYRSAPDASDAGEIKDRARGKLTAAGRRAESLGAFEEACRYYEQASQLGSGPDEVAGLLELAGDVANRAGDLDVAERHLERAIALFEQHDLTHPAARVRARLSMVDWARGRIDEGLARLRDAFVVLRAEEWDEDFATLANQLGRFEFFTGDFEASDEHTDIALEIAESLWVPGVICHGLLTKGMILTRRGRGEEGLALIKHGLELALEHEVFDATWRGYYNLGSILVNRDRVDEGLAYLRSGFARSTRAGYQAFGLLGNMAYPLLRLGDWDEAMKIAEQMPDRGEVPAANLAYFSGIAVWVPVICLHRGEIDRAEALWGFWDNEAADPADVQDRGMRALVGLIRSYHGDRPADAFHHVDQMLADWDLLGFDWEMNIEGFPVAMEAALRYGDDDRIERLLRLVDDAPNGAVPGYVRAHRSRFDDLLAVRREDEEAVRRGFAQAIAGFREVKNVFALAVTMLEFAEWLAGRLESQEAQPLLAEAEEIFGRLKARPWLERLARVGSSGSTLQAAGG